MSVVRSARQPDTYFALVRRFPLTLIQGDVHLDRAVDIINELVDRDDLDRGEQSYLDALTALVERYESEHIPEGAVGGTTVLRHLMEAKGVTQAETARASGVAESTLSQVLAGKRQLGRGHVGKLAAYFSVDPGVFVGDW